MPVRRISRFTSRLDRRGLVLAALGVIWGLYGVAVLVAPTPRDAPRFRQLGGGVLESAMNSPWWGVMWVVCGVTAAAVGLLHAWHRVADDALGFNALLLPPMLWTCAYLGSTIVYVSTWGGAGDARAWIATVIWGAFVLIILIVAGWPDPQWTPPVPGKPDVEVR